MCYYFDYALNALEHEDTPNDDSRNSLKYYGGLEFFEMQVELNGLSGAVTNKVERII